MLSYPKYVRFRFTTATTTVPADCLRKGCDRTETLFPRLKENQRGRFLKITEDVGGRRDTLMLPAEAFKDFLEALERLVEFEAKL